MRMILVEPQDIFQALSDNTRLRIVRLLAETNDEVCLCEISETLDEPEYKLSRHFKILRQSGLLSATKEGRWVYHQVVRNTPFLNMLIGAVQALPDSEKIFNADLKRFKKRLPLRENGRCRTDQSASMNKSTKTR